MAIRVFLMGIVFFTGCQWTETSEGEVPAPPVTAQASPDAAHSPSIQRDLKDDPSGQSSPVPAAKDPRSDVLNAQRPKGRIVLPSQMTPEQRARMDALQSVLRARHFKNQRILSIPDEVMQTMPGVVPVGIEHKTTGYEIHHNMELVRLKPGRYFTKLRWVTPLRGQALKDSLRRSLTESGWVLNTLFFDRGDSVHPQRGRLRIELIEPAERSTTVTATVEREVKDMPVNNPLGRLSFSVPWSKGISLTPSGYELSHFRDVQPGASFTDIERTAIGYRPQDRDAFKDSIRTTAQSMGYVGRGRASQKLVGPKGDSVLPLSTDPDYVVVHAMRTYGHPRNPSEGASSKPGLSD